MKKVLALLMILVLTLSMAGCGDKTTEEANGSTSGGTTESKKVEKKDGDAEVSIEPELEHVTLKFTYPGTNQPDEEMVEEKISEYLKDKINATIDIDPIPWSTFHEKTNLMMATGEQLDMIFTATWYEYNGNVAKKAYLPLDDLIDEFAPTTKETLHPALLEGPKVDGVLYGLPTNKEIAGGNSVMFKKEFLDKYGFELPEYLPPEDFEEVLEPMLKVILENEPGIYPMYIQGLNSLARIYGLDMVSVGDNGSPGKYDTATGKVTYVQENETISMLYDLMYKWYEAGYINADCLTAEGTATNAFMMWQPYKPGKDAEMSTALGAEYVIIPSSEAVVTTGSVTGSMMAISRATADAERCMMFLELLNTDQYLNNLLNYGIEDIHYVKMEDGMIDFPEGIDGSNAAYNPASQWMFQNQFLNYLRKGEDPDKWAKFEEFNNSAEVSPLLGFAFDATPVKTEMAACSNVHSEYEAAVVCGILDPAESIPQYLEKLKANGSEAILAEKQKQIDAFLDGKK